MATAHPLLENFAAETACVAANCLNPATGDWIGQTVIGATPGNSQILSYAIDAVQGNCATCEINVSWGGALQA